MLVDRAAVTLGAISKQILRGNFSNYEDYKAECRYIQGIEFVLTLPALVKGELESAQKIRDEEEEAKKEFDSIV